MPRQLFDHSIAVINVPYAYLLGKPSHRYESRILDMQPREVKEWRCKINGSNQWGTQSRRQDPICDLYQSIYAQTWTNLTQ